MSSAASAPFHQECVDAPAPQSCVFCRTKDGINIRSAYWPKETGARGTVLLLQGRTEYIEKYAPVAARFSALGYAVVTWDWRGQGGSERLLGDPLIGHVNAFGDYQYDIDSIIDRLSQDPDRFPQPWFVLAHSMGGAIGLSAILKGAPIRAAAFSSPMWGIRLPFPVNLVARGLAYASAKLNFGAFYAPFGWRSAHILETPFQRNNVTHDAEQYERMHRQLRAHPKFLLATPSVIWLREALALCDHVMQSKPRDIPILAAVGDHEKFVRPKEIERRIAHWPKGKFMRIDNAKHELMFESQQQSGAFFAAVEAFFAAHAKGNTRSLNADPKPN